MCNELVGHVMLMVFHHYGSKLGILCLSNLAKQNIPDWWVIDGNGLFFRELNHLQVYIDAYVCTYARKDAHTCMMLEHANACMRSPYIHYLTL